MFRSIIVALVVLAFSTSAFAWGDKPAKKSYGSKSSYGSSYSKKPASKSYKSYKSKSAGKSKSSYKSYTKK